MQLRGNFKIDLWHLKFQAFERTINVCSGLIGVHWPGNNEMENCLLWSFIVVNWCNLQDSQLFYFIVNSLPAEQAFFIVLLEVCAIA